jgi:Flp pilus assembly pilin Flp
VPAFPSPTHRPVAFVMTWLLTRRDDRGQATTEYALVLLGAAMVALLLVAWATSGGGAGRIGKLLDKVLDSISGKL